jgi:hypothetical protein
LEDTRCNADEENTNAQPPNSDAKALDHSQAVHIVSPHQKPDQSSIQLNYPVPSPQVYQYPHWGVYQPATGPVNGILSLEPYQQSPEEHCQSKTEFVDGALSSEPSNQHFENLYLYMQPTAQISAQTHLEPYPQQTLTDNSAKNYSYQTGTRTSLSRSATAPPAQTTKTYQPKEVKQRFQWTMEIPCIDSNGKKKHKPAMALLDSQTQKGNWVSMKLLRRLNKTKEIEQPLDRPTLNTPLGPVTAAGTIELSMKRMEGNSYYDCNCYVFPDETGMCFDLILGQEFLVEHEIMTVNDGALMPMVENDKLTSDDTGENIPGD